MCQQVTRARQKALEAEVHAHIHPLAHKNSTTGTAWWGEAWFNEAEGMLDKASRCGGGSH